jgi:Skp family chaperone for outer membrane proteins
MSMQTKKSNNNNTKLNEKQIKKCSYCNLKGRLESNYYRKNANLRKSTSINNTKEEQQVLASSFKPTIDNSIDFVLDSSATVHTCYIKGLFTSLKPCSTSTK